MVHHLYTVENICSIIFHAFQAIIVVVILTGISVSEPGSSWGPEAVGQFWKCWEARTNLACLSSVIIIVCMGPIHDIVDIEKSHLI